jgi:hypothetical protein
MIEPAMRILPFLPALLLAACSSGPSKTEAIQMFSAATTAMASAQSRAVADAGRAAIAAPAQVALDFSGACALGGTVGVQGSYDSSGTGDRAAFDLTTSFDACREPLGTLDGELRWSSVVDGALFHAAMTGELSWTGNDGSASCDFDLSIDVSDRSVSYGGHVCGYDVRADLGLNVPN